MKTTPLTTFTHATEVKHKYGKMMLGFSYVEKRRGAVHHDEELPHFYLVMLLSGRLQVESPFFGTQSIEPLHALLIPQGKRVDWHFETDVQMLICAFDMPLLKAEIHLLQQVCQRAYQAQYHFVTLPLVERIVELGQIVVATIQECKVASKVASKHFYEQMNSALFILFVSYYDVNSVSAFFYPMLNTKRDFKSFVHANYMEAARNVNRLVELSGLPPSSFHKRFKSVFGTTAKQWMMEQERELLLVEAAVEGVTPAMLIEKLHLNNLTQLRLLCKKYFDCSPSELIRRRARELEASTT